MTTKFVEVSMNYEELEAVFRSVKELQSQVFNACEHFLIHVGKDCSSILVKVSGVDDLVYVSMVVLLRHLLPC